MTATLTEAPTAQSPEYAHPKWCHSRHPADQPHQSEAFDVDGDSQTHIVSILQTGDSEPRVVLETIDTGKAGPYVLAFTYDQTLALSDALWEMMCRAQRCDCVGSAQCPGTSLHREDTQ